MEWKEDSLSDDVSETAKSDKVAMLMAGDWDTRVVSLAVTATDFSRRGM
jgi:hypothetical protein